MTYERKVLFRTFRNYRWLAALTILFSLLAATAEIFSITMLIPFLQTLTGDATGAAAQWVSWIDQHLLGGEASTIGRMYLICGVILAATWMRSLFGYLSGLYGTKTRANVVKSFRMQVADQLQAVSLRFYSEARSGEIMNSLLGETGRMAALLGVLIAVTQQGLLVLAYVGFMVWVSWKLTLLVLTFFVVLAISLTRLLKRVRRQGDEMTRAGGHYASTVTELIDGIRTSTAYNMQPFERSRVYRATDRMARAAVDTTRLSLLVQPLSQGVVGTVLILVVAVAVQFLVLPGTMAMAPLLAFLFAMFRLMPAVHQLNNQRGHWAKNRAALTNIADLLRRDDKPYLNDGPRAAPPLRDGITFEQVYFSYEPEEPVLEAIDAFIPRGKMTALIGATGAGKSTLADLIPRFYDPTDGCILYDGVDLREFNVRSLRAKMAVVSQNTYIFNDSVLANIAYGDSDASFEQIVTAAEQANALGFIDKMQDGFETILGDRGVRLSGGQRQRIAIARALLHDPEILILDEATSALDSVTEKQLQESLEALMEGRTVVAIAHRLSTVENADQVIVLEEGRIVEHGTYQDLIDRKGQLWEYHSIQFQLA